MIIGVAIKHNDLVIALPAPNRHHHVIGHMVKVLGLFPPVGHDGQGFYTADGEYLDRCSAKQYAIGSGQFTKKNNHPDGELFSEDLW